VYQRLLEKGSVVKAAILAGGLGTRLQEETTVKPKPMVEVGGRPILWHILKIYAAYGIQEAVTRASIRGIMPGYLPAGGGVA
jgi:glucose-1-phosphate cytidylyltransferase